MLLQIDSKQEVKWATVLFPPDIDDIIYCSVVSDAQRRKSQKSAFIYSHNIFITITVFLYNQIQKFFYQQYDSDFVALFSGHVTVIK